MGNWMDYELEVRSRKDSAAAIGLNSRQVAEVRELEAQRRRVRRMKLLAYVRGLLGRGKRAGNEVLGGEIVGGRPRTG